MEAVILAGGFGTRLRAAVGNVPKPMAPVAGRPFLEHLLDHWIGEGVTRAILAVGYKHDLIRAHFGDNYRDCPLEYSIENSPLGTGGALLAAVPLLREGGPFLALNGDTYFAVRLAHLAQAHRSFRACATLSLFRSPDTGRYTGVTLDGNGRIMALNAPRDSEVLVNGGVLLIERSALPGLPPGGSRMLSLEKDILLAALHENRPMYGYVCETPFVDIGLPEDWRGAQAIIESNRGH